MLRNRGLLSFFSFVWASVVWLAWETIPNQESLGHIRNCVSFKLRAFNSMCFAHYEVATLVWADVMVMKDKTQVYFAFDPVADLTRSPYYSSIRSVCECVCDCDDCAATRMNDYPNSLTWLTKSGVILIDPSYQKDILSQYPKSLFCVPRSLFSAAAINTNYMRVAMV